MCEGCRENAEKGASIIPDATIRPHTESGPPCDVQLPNFTLDEKNCAAKKGSWGYFESNEPSINTTRLGWTPAQVESRKAEWGTYHKAFTQCSEDKKFTSSSETLSSYDLLAFPTMSEAAYEQTARYSKSLPCNANAVLTSNNPGAGGHAFICGHEFGNLAIPTDILINPDHAALRAKCIWVPGAPDPVSHEPRKTIKCPSIKFTLEELTSVHRLHSVTAATPSFNAAYVHSKFNETGNPTDVPLFDPTRLFLSMPRVEKTRQKYMAKLHDERDDSAFSKTRLLSVEQFFGITKRLERMATIQFMATPEELTYASTKEAYAQWAMDTVNQHGIQKGFSWAEPSAQEPKTIRLGFQDPEFGHALIKECEGRDIPTSMLSFGWLGTCDIEERMRERDPMRKNSFSSLPPGQQKTVFVYNTYVAQCTKNGLGLAKTMRDVDSFYNKGIRAFTVPLTWLLEGTDDGAGLQATPAARNLTKTYPDVFLSPFAMERGASKGRQELAPYWHGSSSFNGEQWFEVDQEECYQYLTMHESLVDPRDNFVIIKSLLLDVGVAGIYSDYPFTVSSFSNCVLPTIYKSETNEVLDELQTSSIVEDSGNGDLLKFLRPGVVVTSSSRDEILEEIRNGLGAVEVNSTPEPMYHPTLENRIFLARLKMFIKDKKSGAPLGGPILV